MISDLNYLFDSFMLLFDYNFNIYGITLSFFDIFVFGIIVSVCAYAFFSIFGGD